MIVESVIVVLIAFYAVCFALTAWSIGRDVTRRLNELRAWRDAKRRARSIARARVVRFQPHRRRA